MNRRDLVRGGLAAYAGAYVSRGQWAQALDGPIGSGRALSRVAGPVPTLQQLAWQDAAMGMFVHFGINTFSDREWGLGNEDPATFNPSGGRLDRA